jgi:hypothetical protein
MLVLSLANSNLRQLHATQTVTSSICNSTGWSTNYAGEVTRSQLAAKATVPAMLRICKISRKEGLKHHSLGLQNYIPNSPYINSARDFLVVRNYKPILRLFYTHEDKFGFFRDKLAMGSIRALVFDLKKFLGTGDDGLDGSCFVLALIYMLHDKNMEVFQNLVVIYHNCIREDFTAL